MDNLVDKIESRPPSPPSFHLLDVFNEGQSLAQNAELRCHPASALLLDVLFFLRFLVVDGQVFQIDSVYPALEERKLQLFVFSCSLQFLHGVVIPEVVKSHSRTGQPGR